jgi:hypothetical protein
MILNPYRYAAAASITDPDDVTGCVGWYDASDSASLLDQVVAGSPVADGAAVEVFEDKSALGTIRDFWQTSATLKPLRRAAQINGLDVLEFDGINDFMDLAGGTGNSLFQYSTQAEAKTVFVVSQPITAATLAGSSSVQLYKSSNTGSGGLITGEIAYRANARTFVSAATPDTTCSITAPSIITLSQSGSGTIQSVISMWLDGASVPRDTGGNGLLVAEDVITELGGFSLGGFYFDGYICEVIFYDNELSASDRASVEAYLANKWGVTI